MSGYIKINYEAVKADASQIEDTSSVFQPASLNPDDTVTTLKANENIHSVYLEAQDLIVLLGEAMDREAVNIRSMGREFEEYDDLIADFMAQAGE